MCKLGKKIKFCTCSREEIEPFSSAELNKNAPKYRWYLWRQVPLEKGEMNLALLTEGLSMYPVNVLDGNLTAEFVAKSLNHDAVFDSVRNVFNGVITWSNKLHQK